MPRMLVTGGAGFIGHHLVEALIEKGHDVVVLDDLSSGSKANLEAVRERITFIEGDIRSPEAVDEAMRDAHCIFHLAAKTSPTESMRDPPAYIDCNLSGTIALLEAAVRHKVRRFIFASSAAVYGDAQPPNHEQQLGHPLSPYGITKHACEQALRVWHLTHGLETVSLRYFNIYGPGQDPASSYAVVIPLFINALLKHEQPTIYDDGEQTRDFVHVHDVVRANLLAASRSGLAGETINIASGMPMSINRLYSAITACLGVATEAIHAPPRPGDIRHSHADTTLARKLLGFTPQVSITDGIAGVVEAMRSQKD